jgi:hypothetical protein
MENTTYQDVLSSFHSNPMSKYILADELVYQWFIDALGIYELEIEALEFDEVDQKFVTRLKQYQVKTLGLIMYTFYLTRELSRVEKLQGISSKGISITGNDESKRITYKDLELELKRVDEMLHKQKKNCND